MLLVCALNEELPGHDKLITGVGKVNATLALTRRLASGPLPEAVINLGSAGGVELPTGAVVAASAFYQWDMRCEGLGLERGQTPFEEGQAVLRPTLRVIDRLQQAPAYTGDAFFDDPGEHPPGPCLLEMEAYALAKVCAAFGVPFAAYKFVSDGADGSAGHDWPSALAACGQALSDLAFRL